MYDGRVDDKLLHTAGEGGGGVAIHMHQSNCQTNRILHGVISNYIWAKMLILMIFL